jgi:uncharacterized protein involved in response to NO
MRVRILQEIQPPVNSPLSVHVPPKGGGCAPTIIEPLPIFPCPSYSPPVKQSPLLTLLAALLTINIGALAMGTDTPTSPTGAWWIGFFALVPFGLGLLVWRGFRWAVMACVMYGTVGLAMDIATMVQILAKDPDIMPRLLSSLISGFLNFLLILFGGRSFLDVR